MILTPTTQLARLAIERAREDDAAAFNAQHAMTRAQQYAVASIVAAANRRARVETQRRARSGRQVAAADRDDRRAQPTRTRRTASGRGRHSDVTPGDPSATRWLE